MAAHTAADTDAHGVCGIPFNFISLAGTYLPYVRALFNYVEAVRRSRDILAIRCNLSYYRFLGVINFQIYAAINLRTAHTPSWVARARWGTGGGAHHCVVFFFI